MSLFPNLTVTDLTGLWSCLAARQVAEVVVELDLCLMVRPVDVGECERIMGTLVEVAVHLSYSPLSRLSSSPSTRQTTFVLIAGASTDIAESVERVKGLLRDVPGCTLLAADWASTWSTICAQASASRPSLSLSLHRLRDRLQVIVARNGSPPDSYGEAEHAVVQVLLALLETDLYRLEGGYVRSEEEV